MSTSWLALYRPVLVQVVGAWDRGDTAVAEADYAVALQMTPTQVAQSLRTLVDSGFVEASATSPGQWIITRVCPLSRQVLGGPGDGGCGPQVTGVGGPGAEFDVMVLRATSGP